MITFLLFSNVFLGTNPVNATQMNSEMTDENSLGIVIEKSSDTSESTKSSSIPDLGDDQAFPFIPGFGKNSGKD